MHKQLQINAILSVMSRLCRGLFPLWMILTGWANVVMASQDSGRDLSMLKRNLANAEDHPANYLQVFEKEPGYAVSLDVEELEVAEVLRELTQKMNEIGRAQDWTPVTWP